MSNPFFSWRSAILKSSIPPTTKLVLLTLSCHMNDAGESCYPSINLLCSETGLSNRAVITHLHNAAEWGWINVRKQGLAGQQWSRNSYQLSWDHLTKAVNVETQGSEADSSKEVKEVHTSTSQSTSKSTSLRDSEPASQQRATRLDPSARLDDKYREAALAIKAIDEDELQRVFDDFRDYWIAAPGAKGVKLDWLATWRMWVRRQKTTAAITVKKNTYFDN